MKSKTVAFPLLGAGNCAIPYNTALGIAVREIRNFMLRKKNCDMEVMLVLYPN